MKVVLANGVFDVLHVGHLHYLKEAKTQGEYLVVSVTEDAHVNKGPGRPVFNQQQRAALIAELRCVDEVIVVPSGEEAVRKVRPDVYCKGSEYRNNLPEAAFVESYGGRCHFTTGPVYSSTKLLTGGYLKVPSAVGG